MSGRKPSVPPSAVMDAVLKFKDRVVHIDMNGEKRRYGIKEKLGLSNVQKSIPIVHAESNINILDDNGESLSSDSDGTEMPTKEFVFTFSADEWSQIHPREILYKLNDKSRPMQNSKLYYSFPKCNWTPILAEHFWEHTRLPCCLSFRRGKVTPNGNMYAVVVARCSICGSNFKGIISDRPHENSRVLMHCIYSGNFNEEHKNKRKRRMLGPVIHKSAISLVNEGMACETYREKEAMRLMKMGDCEPAILPTGNALRLQKSKQIRLNKRNDDTLTALTMMKGEDEFKGVIRDIGCDPFFVHYHSSEQIHLYRSYCKNKIKPTLVIDATGSVIKKFKKLGLGNSNVIYLYECVVYDKTPGHSFTATNMISERHSNSAIANWLGQWAACDVPKPKETICDNSLALISAICQVFTQYSLLQDYVRMCADILTGRIASDSHWTPRCFIRIDVAHFIKIVCRWVPLKNVSRRVREVILRAIGLIIKSQSLTDIRSMLLTLFVVLSNETDGVKMSTNLDTPCEKYKKKILHATSTGFQDFQEDFNNILTLVEDEDATREILEEEYERQNIGLDSFENPFQSWAKSIYDESKTYLEEGTGINPFYCPSLVPIIIKSLKLLPLWSGLMIPIFGYGEEVASSATVESSFKKLKQLTFKNIELPTNIEIFLENHVLSLKGASIIRGQNSSALSAIPEEHNSVSNNEMYEENSQSHLTNTSFLRLSSPGYLYQTIDESTIEIINRPTNSNDINNKDSDDSIGDIHNNFVTSATNYFTDCKISPKRPRSNSNEFQLNNVPENVVSTLRCPLCKSGNLPLENVAHKCVVCLVTVHDIPSCSTRRKGKKDQRICLTCSEDVLSVLDELEEYTSVETWKRTSKKQRNSNSYLCHNPNLRHLQLKSSKRIQTLPILKNGSRAQELKSCTIRNVGKVILSNTCAFDTVSSILLVAIYDSDDYKLKVDECNNELLKFTAELITHGITSSTYTKRAEIMLNRLNPELEMLGYNTTLAKCETVASNIFNCTLAELPSAYDYVKCNILTCGRKNEVPIPITIITYTTNCDGIQGLQSYLNSRINIEKMKCSYINDNNEPCEGLKTKTTKISEFHLFVEILNWEGDDNVNFSSEAVPQLQISLRDIPEILISSGRTYELRGVGCYRRSLNSLRTSTGHYYACCKRGTNNWEMFDDLQNNVKQIKSSTIVPCEFLIYTI